MWSRHFIKATETLTKIGNLGKLGKPLREVARYFAVELGIPEAQQSPAVITTELMMTAKTQEKMRSQRQVFVYKDGPAPGAEEN